MNNTPSADIYQRWAVPSQNNFLVFGLIKTVCMLIPQKVLYRVSESVMEFINIKFPYARTSVRKNLLSAFPEKPFDEIVSMAEKTLLNYGRGVIDYFTLSLGKIDYNSIISTESLLLNPLPKCGVVLAMAHIGNWEMGGAFMKEIGRRVVVVAQPERDEGVENLRKRLRKSYSLETSPSSDGLTGIIARKRFLEEGGILVYLCDRAVGKDRIDVNFFGRRSYFLKSPALMAISSNCPLVPCLIERSGEKYAVRIANPIYPSINQKEKKAGDIMQYAAEFFESFLCEHPDEWYNFFPYWENNE